MSEFSLKAEHVAAAHKRADFRRSSSDNSFPSKTFVHAQLEVSQSGDQDELEAESVAREFTNGGKIHRSISQGGKGTGINVSSKFEQKLFSRIGGGSEMAEGLRSRMESDFGHDFSGVRIHADASAAEMSRSIGAKAFTYGKDIFFNQDQYSPESQQGQSLLAHELTHVAQDNGRISREETDEKNQCLISDANKYIVGQSQNELKDFLDDYSRMINFMIVPGEIEDDDNGTELVSIGGRGYVGSKKEIRSWEKQHKREVFFGTLGNIQGGLGGSLAYGAALMNGVTDPEMIYMITQLGAGVDAMAGAFYNNGSDNIFVGRPQTQLSVTPRRASEFNPSRPTNLLKYDTKYTEPVNKFKESNRMMMRAITNMGRSSAIRDKAAVKQQALLMLEKAYKETTTNMGSFSKLESIEALQKIKSIYENTVDIAVETGSSSSVEMIDRAYKNITLIEMRIEVLQMQNEAAAIESAPLTGLD